MQHLPQSTVKTAKKFLPSAGRAALGAGQDQVLIGSRRIGKQAIAINMVSRTINAYRC
jgi:F0F1-type ATP synthase alpha subunit